MGKLVLNSGYRHFNGLDCLLPKTKPTRPLEARAVKYLHPGLNKQAATGGGYISWLPKTTDSSSAVKLLVCYFIYKYIGIRHPYLQKWIK